MKSTLKQLEQQMTQLFWKIVEEKEELMMDGVWGYNEKAQFVGGKVINLSCYVVLELLRDTEDYPRGLAALKDVLRMVSAQPMETWGILNGVTGLWRLKQAGLLEQTVEADTLECLKRAMDWRTFVDAEDHYTLIQKPANYYGVAFGIARYRELLGWEPEGHSQILLDYLMKHIETYSGEYCYMDETRGEGRFDRYSILIPAETTALLLAGGMEVPELIRTMLHNSAHIVLKLANTVGTGFSYGRSIGAYGDTAFMEILSAAGRLGGIFTDEERKLAFGFHQRVLKQFVSFWYDEEMQSINMWEKGRGTDEYRGKNRILGENISLRMQLVNCLEHWKAVGMDPQGSADGWEALLKTQARASLIRFAKDEYDRALIIVRDGRQVWSLPLINGGASYYDRDPYLPVPRQNYVLEGVPECGYGAMVPRFVLENGGSLMPISYINTIEMTTNTTESEESCTVVCQQDALCLIGEELPRKAEGSSVTTTYRFAPGMIKREDVFRIGAGWQIKEIILEFQIFSTGAKLAQEKICFALGSIASIEAVGYDERAVEVIGAQREYDTPHGRLNSRVVWKKTEIPAKGEIRLQWKIMMRG